MVRTIPEEFDLSVLCGLLLVQVQTGLNEVIIAFEPSAQVTCLGYAAVTCADSERSVMEAGPPLGAKLHALLHRTVKRAEAGDNGRSLILTFDDASVLEVLSDSEQFENFLIGIGSKLVVV